MATPVPRPVGSSPTLQTPRPAVTPQRPPGATAAARPPAKSRLGAVSRGILRVPLRHLFYGPRGVGKTSLGADAPSPLFFDVEGGSPLVNVTRYTFRDEPGGHVPRSYEEVLSGIDDVLANPEHGYQSLVFDTFDALETLLHEYICRRDGKANIEAYGYGKGYKIPLPEIRVLLERLDRVIHSGVAVVILAHSEEKTYKNPRGPDYDRFRAQLNEIAWGRVAAWCDVVGFVNFESGGSTLKGDESQTKRARGWSTGRRMIQLTPDAAAPDVKCRLSLPTELELGEAHPWAPFAEAKLKAEDATIETLSADILIEIDRITGGDRDVKFSTDAGTQTSHAAIQELITKGDESVLARVLAGLRATTTTVTQEITP
jgi:AAA domain-containing protein